LLIRARRIPPRAALSIVNGQNGLQTEAADSE
jgi:hypothetical protein